LDKKNFFNLFLGTETKNKKNNERKGKKRENEEK
jgi:hypothetical protein